MGVEDIRQESPQISSPDEISAVQDVHGAAFFAILPFMSEKQDKERPVGEQPAPKKPRPVPRAARVPNGRGGWVVFAVIAASFLAMRLMNPEQRRFRELSQTAQQALPWFDYPYGDPGKEAVKDEKGNVIEEAVDPVHGYVSGMRDAMILPQLELEVDGVLFALPQMACNNLTWQQYRSLQAISPQLFQEGISEEDALELQAEFLSQILVPARSNTTTTDRFAPKYDFTYNTERAEQSVAFWRERLATIPTEKPSDTVNNASHAAVLFHICFQCYQTALAYYAKAYPLLFSDDGKKDQMKDALQGEVGTINTIMKYAGYAEQQQVYDSNLPFVLDILNTMAKEAKEIEKMNARIKSKRH